MILARHGEKVNAYRIFMGKRERKIILVTSRHRCEDNIKMDLRKVGRSD
jgi:hypothetical protein